MLIGYAGYALLLFLPGFALLAVFGKVKDLGVVSVLSRAYGLSLAIDTLVVFAATVVGLSVPYLPAPMLLASVLILALFLPWRNRSGPALRKRVSRADLAVLLLAVAFVGLIMSHFLKYPIFPKTYSVDFSQHVMLTTAVLSYGAGGLSGLLYYGVHFNLALGMASVGGNTFLRLPYLMAVMMAPSSLLVYEALRSIQARAELAVFAQFTYVGTGFLWYIPLFDAGLYPNMFAIVLSFYYLVELSEVLRETGYSRFVLFGVVALSMYLTHYFTPIFLAAAMLSLVLARALGVFSTRRVLAPMLITLLPTLSLAAEPDLIGFALRILRTTGGSDTFTFTTPLANTLSFNPFLHFATAEIFNYGALIMLAGLPLSFYYVWQHRRDAPLLSVLPAWFLLMWVLAPDAELAWRFSFQALAPALLLVPFTTYVLVMNTKRLSSGGGPKVRHRRHPGRPGIGATQGAVLLAVILLLVVGSPTSIMLGDLTSGRTSYANAQTDLYGAMVWFQHSTPANAQLLSTTDWRVTFLQPITGKNGLLLPLANASQAVSYARAHDYGYILVTYLIPAVVPTGFDLSSFYSSYSADQNLKVVYQNPDVLIYQVVT